MGVEDSTASAASSHDGRVVIADDESFPLVANFDGVTIVDFWAPWCGPCRSFAPVFESSAVELPQVQHVKVNVDDNPALSSYFDISSIPTLVVLRGGFVLGSVAGALTPSSLRALIDEALALDMDQVRAEAVPPSALSG